MSASYRGRRALALLAMALAAACTVPRILTHNPYQRLGVTLNWGRGQDFPVVTRVVGPPAVFLLERGDELRGIDGTLFRGSDDMRAYLRHNDWPHGPFTLTINRGGRTFNVVVPIVQLGAWQRLRLYIFPVAAIIAAPLVAILLVWRRPDLSTAWVFLWFATLQAVGVIWGLYRYPVFEPSGPFKVYLAAYHAIIYWFPASFLHFMTVFPRPRWDPRRRRRSPWFWLVVAAYLVPVALLANEAIAGGTDERAYIVFQSIVLPLGVLSLLGRYYARPSLDWSPRTSERVLAVIVGVVLILAVAIDAVSEDPRMTVWFGLPAVRLVFTTVTIAWLISPFLIALLIANDPVFDPRRLLVRSLPYAVLSGVLAGLYLAIVLGAQRVFASVTGEQAMVFNVVAALVVAFAFAPVRDSVQRWIDQLFGRDPHALRLALDRTGPQLLGALSRDEVRGAVEDGLTGGMKRDVAIEWPERGMPRLGEGEELPEPTRRAVENLLLQAGIRLENLALQEEHAAAERREVELREAATLAELRALQAQVQPHFLFNALNALAYLIETDAGAAQRFTERLAAMLRYTIEAGSRPATLLSDEIGFVEDYLGVARERYENALTFETHVPAELLSVTVPPLLLQPLVENSLKHGCDPLRPLHLGLEARCQDGWLDLSFVDDGAANGNGVHGLGVGLENLEQRLRRFGGPDATVVPGPRNGGGYEVRLRWPMRARRTA